MDFRDSWKLLLRVCCILVTQSPIAKARKGVSCMWLVRRLQCVKRVLWFATMGKCLFYVAVVQCYGVNDCSCLIMKCTFLSDGTKQCSQPHSSHMPVKIYFHRHGQFLDLSGRMGYKVYTGETVQAQVNYEDMRMISRCSFLFSWKIRWVKCGLCVSQVSDL